MEVDQKPYKEIYCSAELTDTIHNHLICLSVLNIILSISTLFGNVLILIGLHKDTSLYPASKLLFRCLATTDLCVGAMVGPLHVSYWISALNEQWEVCRYSLGATLMTANMLCSVSLLTLAAIGVDRLLSLLLGNRHKRIVTLTRIYVTLIIFWLVSCAGSIASIWNELASSWYSYVIIPSCLMISLFCYTKIFVKLRHFKRQAQGNFHRRVRHIAPLNVARYRKVLYSALWLQVTLIFCYSPYIIMAPVAHRQIEKSLSSSFYIALQVTITILYLNSLLNPILYYFTIKGVRKAVKSTVRQLFCSLN